MLTGLADGSVTINIGNRGTCVNVSEVRGRISNQPTLLPFESDNNSTELPLQHDTFTSVVF